jgi:hypothetical protein
MPSSIREVHQKNGYGYFVGIGTIVTTAIIVAALIFAAKTFF